MSSISSLHEEQNHCSRLLQAFLRLHRETERRKCWWLYPRWTAWNWCAFLVTAHHVTLTITSQPGKTLWLTYVLVRLLNENKAVAYYSAAGTFLFFENSVYSRILGQVTGFPPSESAIFCLIDSDRHKVPADTTFMTDRTLVNKTFPIMATSPNPSRYDTWKKQRGLVPIEIMPLWKRYELKTG